MALDSQDFELMKTVRAAVRETGQVTAKKLDEVVAAQRALLAASEKSLNNDQRLIEAFNRMATAIDGLASEVRALREDLSPPVDKPKLPIPRR
jgi:hypothetical protein